MELVPVASYRLLKSNTFQLQGTCSQNFNSTSSYSAKKERKLHVTFA